VSERNGGKDYWGGGGGKGGVKIAKSFYTFFRNLFLDQKGTTRISAERWEERGRSVPVNDAKDRKKVADGEGRHEGNEKSCWLALERGERRSLAIL